MRIVYRASGTSLIEVMVTLLLIVTAAAGLVRSCAHVRATASHAASQQAAWRLTSELAEWLRLRGDQPLGPLPEDPASLIAAPAGTGDCYRSACTPADAARFFLHDWYRRLRERLPGVRLMICAGGPAESRPSGQSGAACAGQARAEGVVWFRLWRPHTAAGADLLRMIEVIVRRAP